MRKKKGSINLEEKILPLTAYMLSRDRTKIKKDIQRGLESGAYKIISSTTGEILPSKNTLNTNPLKVDTKIKPFTKNAIMIKNKYLLKQLGNVHFAYVVMLGNILGLGTNRVDPTWFLKEGILKEAAYKNFLAKLRKHDIIRKLKIKFLNDTKKRYYFNPYLAQAGKSLPTELFEEFKNSKHYDRELF